MGKIPDGYWPCACVKRDKAQNMTHIKFHPPTTKKCKVCEATRPPKGWDKQNAASALEEPR